MANKKNKKTTRLTKKDISLTLFKLTENEKNAIEKAYKLGYNMPPIIRGMSKQFPQKAKYYSIYYQLIKYNPELQQIRRENRQSLKEKEITIKEVDDRSKYIGEKLTVFPREEWDTIIRSL